jgi:hypothetical protein
MEAAQSSEKLLYTYNLRGATTEKTDIREYHIVSCQIPQHFIPSFHIAVYV